MIFFIYPSCCLRDKIQTAHRVHFRLTKSIVIWKFTQWAASLFTFMYLLNYRAIYFSFDSILLLLHLEALADHIVTIGTGWHDALGVHDVDHYQNAYPSLYLEISRIRAIGFLRFGTATYQYTDSSLLWRCGAITHHKLFYNKDIQIRLQHHPNYTLLHP